MRLQLFSLVFFLSCIVPMHMYGMLEIAAYKLVKQIVDHAKNHTAPIHFVGVNGALYQDYSVVEATITVPPNEKPQAGQLAPSTKIQRASLGLIGGSTSTLFLPDRFQMKVPSVPLDLNAAIAGLPEMMTKVAGAAGPEMGAAVGAISAVTELGLQIATEELSNMFGEQETDLTMLEILPNKYYRINADKNTIEMTPQFTNDIADFNKAYQNFVQVAGKYNALLKDYNYRLSKFNTKYPYGLPTSNVPQADQNEYNALTKMANDQIKSLLKEVITAMLPLQNYGMHRITIMSAYAKPGDACQDPYKGPLYLYIYYFVGAKVTNIFKVPYCIKNGNDPYLVINISQNDFNKATGEFIPGGVQFVAADKNGNPVLSFNDTTIAFPYKTGTKVISRTQSQKYSWWEEIFTSSDEYGSSLLSYMLPFDIYNTEKLKKEIEQSKWQAAVGSADKLLDLSVQYFKSGGKGEQDLKKAAEAKGSGTGGEMNLSKSIDLLSGLLGIKGNVPSTGGNTAIPPIEDF